MTPREPGKPYAHILSLAITWCAIASGVIVFMLYARKILEGTGLILPVERTFLIFGIAAVVFFIFIPPVSLRHYMDEDGEPGTSLWEVLALYIVLAAVTLPFLLIIRRLSPVSKVQIIALLSTATICGLASALFYVVFPRLHFSFITAVTFGFPFLYLLVVDGWGVTPSYLASFSPVATIYYISPEMVLDKVGLPWSNTVLIFGLIAAACAAWLLSVSRARFAGSGD